MLNIFKNKQMVYVAAGVSLLLQILSFLTTYQGSVYYFKGIFVLAPLLFAVAVQMVVYFQENALRNRRNVAKVLSLVLAMCCSSYFSYIGIYNNVNSPLTYYQETYTEYKNTLESQYKNLINEADKKAQQELNVAVTDLTTTVVGWNTKQQELKDIIAQLDGVPSTNTTSMTAPQRYNFSTYEEYAKAYEAYVKSNAKSNATESNSNTKSILKKHGYSSRTEVVEEQAKLKGKKKNMTESIHALCASVGVASSNDLSVDLETIRSTMADSISEGKNVQKISQGIYKLIALHNQYYPKNILDAELLTQCISLHENEVDAIMRDYADISEKDPSKCKSSLQWEISKGIAEINHVYDLIGSKEKVEAKSYELQDIYVLPILRLLQSDTRKMAVLCLTIALLTDVLSLIFALMYVPDKEHLKIKSVDDMIDRENPVFEKNIASALGMSMLSQQNDSLVGNELGEIELKRLADFIDRFQVSPTTLKRGFSLQTEVENVEEYQVLVALLCQLKLAKYVSKEEFETKYKGSTTSDVLLLKTNFVYWCNSLWEADVMLEG